MEINGNVGNLSPAVPKTPEPMITKFGKGDEVGNTYRCAKFHYDRSYFGVELPSCIIKKKQDKFCLGITECDLCNK